MATTKAQRAASAKYDRANTRQISIKLNVRTDAQVLAHLESQPNVQGYIKRLVINDMYRHTEDEVNTATIKRGMLAGLVRVDYSTVGDTGTASFDGIDSTVARWLVREFDACQEYEGGPWVVYCGDGQRYDYRIMTILDELLANPYADAQRFTTIGDATKHVEEALGEYVADYDVEAIAREITDWVDGKLTLVVDDDQFWSICAEHDISEQK